MYNNWMIRQALSSEIQIIMEKNEYRELMDRTKRLQEEKGQLEADKTTLIQQLKLHLRPSELEQNYPSIVRLLTKQVLRLSRRVLTQVESSPPEDTEKIEQLEQQVEALQSQNKNLKEEVRKISQQLLKIVEEKTGVDKLLLQKESEVKNVYYLMDENRRSVNEQKRLVKIQEDMLRERDHEVTFKYQQYRELEEKLKERQAELEKQVRSLSQFSHSVQLQQQNTHLNDQLSQASKDVKKLNKRIKTLESELSDAKNRIEYQQQILAKMEHERSNEQLENDMLFSLKKILGSFRQKMSQIDSPDKLDQRVLQKKKEILYHLDKNSK